MDKTQVKVYRFITLLASFLIFLSIFNLSITYNDEDILDFGDNEFDENLTKLESISFSKAIPIINVKFVSSILKRENIGITDGEFDYISPIKREYLTIDDSLVELIGRDNYDRYRMLQVSEYNCNIYSFIKYFNINQELFSNLKLYSQEEIEILFSQDPQRIVELVMVDGAYYSSTRNTIYTVEWLKTATIDDILNEEIDLNKLRLIMDKTANVIDGVLDNSSGASYKLKIIAN